MEIARKHGVELPSWIRFDVAGRSEVLKDFAEYRLSTARNEPTRTATWADLMTEGRVTVRMNPEVLGSDEQIVAVIAHEVHELMRLRQMVESNDETTFGDVLRAINTNSNDNLHGEAWAVGDLYVLEMRAPTPEIAAQIRHRRSQIQARLR
jgi:hypothetical protein